MVTVRGSCRITPVGTLGEFWIQILKENFRLDIGMGFIGPGAEGCRTADRVKGF